MLQNTPHPPQKSQRTKSLTPQLEQMTVQSVIGGYLAIRIRAQTFCVVGVLRCRVFLASAPRLCPETFVLIFSFFKLSHFIPKMLPLLILCTIDMLLFCVERTIRSFARQSSDLVALL